MRECIEKISNFIDEHKEEMIDFWRNIVNLESSAREKANVDILAEYLKSEFEKEGLECRLVEVGPDNGKSLIGVLGNGINKEPVIFSGHIDTVFSKGSFGDKPFRIEGGKAYGPGVLDMKGGVVITLFIIKALRNIGYKERPIKIVLLADEEKGHQNASTPELLMTETKGGLCAFNMETGLIDNSLCVGRKGGGVCYVTVKGKEAHAGNDYLIGRNAIEEAANKIIDIQKLTDLNQDTTVSVTIVKGGSVQNSIPGECKMDIDIRYAKFSEKNRVLKEIQEICNKTSVDGTQTKMEYVEMLPPFETTENVMKLFEFINETAEKFGIEKSGYKMLGGGSDASYITMAGTPVVCSCGVRGEWNHTAREYALVDSILDRTKLLTSVVLNLDNLKF